MVLACKVDGRWSDETQAFLRQLAKAKARTEVVPLQSRARAAWLRRWMTIMACSSARAFASSLLEARRSGGAPQPQPQPTTTTTTHHNHTTTTHHNHTTTTPPPPPPPHHSTPHPTRPPYVMSLIKGIKLRRVLKGKDCCFVVSSACCCPYGPIGLVTSFEPWTHWIPLGLRGFYKWALDILDFLNEIVWKVVRHRQTSRLQAWSNWIWEDFTSIRISGFARSLSLWFLIWFASPILVRPALIDAHFGKAWML